MKKICSVCGVEKELEDFNRQKLGKYGRRASCRVCQNKENKEYKTTDKAKELNKAWKKSDAGKACAKRYRENNSEHIKEYCKTEEYKTRSRKSADNQRFEGNRAKVLSRDNNKCVICGSTKGVQVHHKDGKGRNTPKELRNNDIDNLITLCASCHIKQHNPVLMRWKREREVMPL